MSTHEIPVVCITSIEPHPNADQLELIQLWGFTVVVRKGEWHSGDLGYYVPPDYVVPDRAEFAFLQGHNRIRTKRLRGIYSMGLLMPAPEGAKEGDDLLEALGIVRYEPPVQCNTGGEDERGPEGYWPKYDLENWRRYGHLLVDGELVWISEKLHGCNGFYIWANDRMYCSSHTRWKREDANNLWWLALAQNAWIRDWCSANLGYALYGEVFGQVQKGFTYGTNVGQVLFRAFDVLTPEKRWLAYEDVLASVGKDGLVPMLYVGSYSSAVVEQYSVGASEIPGAKNMREGCVIKPLQERYHPEIGRVALKCVSNDYLERGK